MNAEISSEISKRITTGQLSSYTEIGHSVLIRRDGNILNNAKVRHRYSGVAGSTIKITNVKRTVCPGMVYTESDEFTVESPSCDNAMLIPDSHHIVVGTRALRIGDWILVLRSYGNIDQMSCELEYTLGSRPSSIMIFEFIHSELGHVRSMRPYIPHYFHSLLRSSANPIKDILHFFL